MIARTEIQLMTLACFFAACRDGRSSHTFGYVQLNCHQGGFMVPLATGISVDLNISGRYAAFLEPVSMLSSASLRWSFVGGRLW